MYSNLNNIGFSKSILPQNNSSYTFFPELQNNIYNNEIFANELSKDSVLDYTQTLPDCKLYYPEPFIASASFLHEEIWFIHILHYNYWLWFFFITLIMFYFVTFIHMVRWCNLRIKPKRETRGVSRSKCADLITACVPVSWALSIIISETVDATDYYDGFGTGEVVIGIRAYQWGWEYFYPKSIDLNYNVRPSYSTVIGNSIKYNNTSNATLDTSTLWKFYQNKNRTAQSTTPGSILLSPNNSDATLNNIDFSFIGNNINADSNAFSKVHRFSKLASTNNTSLLTSSNRILTKLNNLYITPQSLTSDSYQYGSNRQHSLSSLNTFLPSFSTLVDNVSFKKFFSYSCNTTSMSLNTLVDNSKFFNILYSSTDKGNPNRYIKWTDDLESTIFLQKFIPWEIYDSTVDAKKSSNPLRAVALYKLPKKIFLTPTNLACNSYNDVVTNTKPNMFTWNIFNQPKHYRYTDLKFSGSQFLTPDKNPRLTINKPVTTTNFESNRYPYLKEYWEQLRNPAAVANLTSFSMLNSSGVSSSVFTRSLLNNTTVALTSNPLTPLLTKWGYDAVNKYGTDDSPSIFRGKEDSAPSYLFNSNWLSHYTNMNLNRKYTVALNNLGNLTRMYFPTTLRYAEYDFKNMQALETVEDLSWESSHPMFAHEDYLGTKDRFLTSTYFDQISTLYNKNNRTLKSLPTPTKSSVKDSGDWVPNFYIYTGYLSVVTNSYSNLNKFHLPELKVYKSLSQSAMNTLYSVPLSTEFLFTNPGTFTLKNFAHLSNDASSEALDDCYENLKMFKSTYTYISKNFLFNATPFLTARSFSNVLDTFRADFDDAAWSTDDETTLESSNSFAAPVDAKLTNSPKLRSTAKNSIVTYNAMQKVYKARFDDLRANINFADLTNSYASYPFLIEAKTPYENILKKNKEVFYNLNFYHQCFNTNYSTLVEVFSSLNLNFTEIPFLLSLKSDAARYLWFDWQAKWSSIEVQPSSIAKYSLAGLPYASKKYEYTSALGDELNDSENYLLKISRARKNFLPSWAYSTYFYSRVTNWFLTKNNMLFFNFLSTTDVKVLLKTSDYYWIGPKSNVHLSNTMFTPSYSNLNRANTVTWSPLSGIASYYYYTTVLIDILTKREYLYRTFFTAKAGTTHIPKYISVSPNNSLLREVRSAYPFIDPTTYSSEVTRELLYNNLDFLQYSLLRDFLKLTNQVFYYLPINFTLLNNYFVHLLGRSNGYGSVAGNVEAYKSQYRPMRKGITNMIRLQATSAIAMPTEIRLHILASSKDVIHSWAIPSAGIKIDCVPGFSSHRVAIFLQHGIFWGQCMEICGRYHHWMPIIVYFMKRDLFFLWCTHFIHYSDIDQSFNMVDKQLSNYVKLVSFDKATWVNEINNLLS